MYSYDPSTMSWTQLADMADAREAPTSNWVNGQLYVVGGWDENGNSASHDPGVRPGLGHLDDGGRQPEAVRGIG